MLQYTHRNIIYNPLHNIYYNPPPCVIGIPYINTPSMTGPSMAGDNLISRSIKNCFSSITSTITPGSASEHAKDSSKKRFQSHLIPTQFNIIASVIVFVMNSNYSIIKLSMPKSNDNNNNKITKGNVILVSFCDMYS